MIREENTGSKNVVTPRGRDALKIKLKTRGLSSAENQNAHNSGKVIRLFTVEIADASSAPELYTNSSNPYTELSDEERAKEFDAVFGLLLAESYREAGQGMEMTNVCKE